MRKTCAKDLLTGILLLGAVLLVSGAALARDHGADPAGQDAGAAAVAASDSEPNTTHDEPGHAQAGHADPESAAAHGEEAHGEAHGEGHGEDHGEGHSSIPHLQNLITGWIAPYVPETVGGALKDFIDPIYSLAIALLLGLFFISLRGKLDPRRPGRTQMAVEVVFGGLYTLFESVIGPTARRYTPYLGTLFIFILCNNLAGMFPLGHAATSVFNTTTFALGAMTFLYVQGIALKENGLLGYLHHMAGSPKTAMDWGFSVLLFPLHLLGELIKPISLSLRLFGNIFGEDTLVATMVILGYLIVKGLTGIFAPDDSAVFGFLPGVPLQLPFYFLGLLSSTIQALVFTLLSTVYIALWLPHGDHGEAHGH